MKLTVEDSYVDFLSDEGALAGRYVFRNAFKPYLHPLNTPDGHTLSLAMPHDHKHQRGVMYALRASDINFWEERVVREGEAIGVQRHEELTEVLSAGDVVWLVQEVVWAAQDGSLDTFSEERRISCTMSEDGFAWRWQAKLTSLRDMDLVMSQWAHARADGALVNYHGLGFRLRRDFGGIFHGTTIFCDRVETPPADAMGMAPAEVTFLGSIDGYEVPPRAGVSIRQAGAHTMFLMTDPYPLISFGPSNRGPVHIAAGDVLDEDFQFSVFDGVPAGLAADTH